MIRNVLMAGVMVFALSATVRAEDAPKSKPVNPAFEKMKKLVGTWVEADKEGKPTDKVVSIIKLTAGGSAIQETHFPGDAMEMVSVYTTDKDDLIMTHYCVLGNQPRMKADPKSSEKEIKWIFIGGSNLDVTKDPHMHGGTLTIVDNDHLVMKGEAWAGGKPAEDHCVEMKLVRKKDAK